MVARLLLPRPLVFLLALALLSLVGCGRRPQPLAFTIPWTDGEISRYDVLGKDGKTHGTASWTVRRAGDGWSLAHNLTRNGKTEKSDVAMDASLHPLSSATEDEGGRTEATYGASVVAIRTTPKEGTVKESSVPRPDDAVDNDAALTVQRALPLGPGYAARTMDVVPKTGSAVPVDIEVLGEEVITVPAGTFATWHISMGFGMIAHDAWYQKELPHLLVKYKNSGSGAVFVLRSWQTSPGGQLFGSAEPPSVLPPREGPVPLNIPFLVTSVLVQWPLMLVLPILIGRRLKKRFGLGWKLWLMGALTFVLSQVVHIPLNWTIGLIGAPRRLGLLPLPLFALTAGLSAGLCEEIARYLMLRFALPRARTYREALQFGAGHGGIEAMIIGVLAAVSLVVMLVLRAVPLAKLGIPAEAAAQVADATSAFFQSAWYAPILGGVERIFAMTAHIALSVLVMRAVARRQIAYLLAAIGAHAAMDGVAVWSVRTLGATVTEGMVALWAAAFLYLIYALREDPPPS